MGNYKIIQFDTDNKEIIVEFSYKDHVVQDRVPVKDFLDAQAITALVSEAYKNFVHAMDELDAQRPVISEEVQSLLDNPIDGSVLESNA